MLTAAPLGFLARNAIVAGAIALAASLHGVLAQAQPAVPPGVSTAPADTVGAATRDVLSQVKGQKRVALVIGNSRYQNVSRLPNPGNDAEDIAAALKSLGFTVRHVHDVGKAAMEMALAEFSDEAVGADIALVFYAGHGIEVDRRNYLIPVDAKLDTDRRLLFETVALDYVLASLDGVKGIRIVLLDACRNNPFSASMEVSSATRSIGRGLSAVEASQGTLISFAAKEGAVADDGEGQNSPFTSALLANLREPGVEIGILFRKVRDSVLTATDGRQEPYISASLPSDSIYIVPAPDVAVPTAFPQPTQAASNKSERAAKAWETVGNMTSVAVLEAFVEEFEGTVYSTFAEARLKELKAEQGPPVPSQSREGMSVPAAPATNAGMPDANVFSKSIWPRIKFGVRVSKMTPYGQLSCIGGSRKKRIRRQCQWATSDSSVSADNDFGLDDRITTYTVWVRKNGAGIQPFFYGYGSTEEIAEKYAFEACGDECTIAKSGPGCLTITMQISKKTLFPEGCGATPDTAMATSDQPDAGDASTNDANDAATIFTVWVRKNGTSEQPFFSGVGKSLSAAKQLAISACGGDCKIIGSGPGCLSMTTKGSKQTLWPPDC